MEYRTSVSGILNGEEHVKDIALYCNSGGICPLEMTGKRVLGIGDAAGMFPIDILQKITTRRWLRNSMNWLLLMDSPWKLRDIMPKALVAGDRCRCSYRRRCETSRR